MSTNLKKTKNFLEVILENNQKVNMCIVFHASSKQLEAMAETFYNVFCLPLSPSIRSNLLKTLRF